jgi:hypothetical protein
MVFNIIQIKLLQQYRDKSYILAILSNETSDYYSYLKRIINIPLIILNTTLSIVNALNVNHIVINYINVVSNISLALIIGFSITNHIYEKQINFRNLYLKYTKLTHLIEDKLTNEIDNIKKEDLTNIIKEYDLISEFYEFPYPNFIKKKIRNRYLNSKRTLPNILYNDEEYNKENIIENIVISASKKNLLN